MAPFGQFPCDLSNMKDFDAVQQIQLNKPKALKQGTPCDECVLTYLVENNNLLYSCPSVIRAQLKEWKHTDTSVLRIAPLVSSACLRSSAT